MGVAGKQPVGVVVLWRNHSSYSQLQEVRTWLDAAEAGATAVGRHCAGRSCRACAGRFSTPDRVNSAICRGLPRSLLGKQVVARKVQVAAKIRLWFKIKTHSKL